MSFSPPNSYTPGTWIQINGLAMMTIFLVTALILWLKGRKSENLEVRIKGLLFLTQTLFLFLGMVISLIAGFIALSILGFIFIILSGIFLYISQTWPEWARNILMRNK
jgi:hypothetical protein